MRRRRSRIRIEEGSSHREKSESLSKRNQILVKKLLLIAALVAASASSAFLSAATTVLVHAQEQNVMTMNGGSVLAMSGKGCVALAVDKRFGRDFALVSIQPRQVLLPTPRLMLAFTGLEGDVQSLRQELSAQVATQYARGLGFGGSALSRRKISPRAMASLTSHVLYQQKSYFVEPIVAGLEVLDDDENKTSAYSDEASTEIETPNSPTEVTKSNSNGAVLRYRPYLCAMDAYGAKSTSSAFVCGGAASESLYGTAEALWKPNLSSQELVEVCGKAFLSALERNILSGYGATVYLITPDGVTEYDLITRND